MKLRFWQRETVCNCEPKPGPVPTPEVSALSPARLLAKSLTDPETRREWVTSYPERISFGMGGYTRYRNEARDITLTRFWGGYSGGEISTPFTLSEAEKRIVANALTRLDRWRTEEREKEVLARLIAPASGIEAATADETALAGSAEGESPVPEGQTPNSPSDHPGERA